MYSFILGYARMYKNATMAVVRENRRNPKQAKVVDRGVPFT